MTTRREFLQLLAVAAAGGMGLSTSARAAQQASAQFYDLPRFGNVHLLHFTDCHAQLKPIYFREPSVNRGVAGARNQPPHLVGDYFLKHYGFAPGSAQAYAYTCLDFEQAARRYGLTPAEARVVQALMNGCTIGRAAGLLGIGEATVKTHLQHIFDKTHARRQAQLIKLIAEFPPGQPQPVC